jgi:hypothetical protein
LKFEEVGGWSLARVAFLTGAVGGIIGSIAAGLGIIWSMVFMIFAVEFRNYIQYLLASYTPLIIFFIPYPSSSFLFSSLLLMVSLLLIVAGVLSGVGFYGVYKVGGGAMGMVGLIFAIVGSVLGVLFIITGVLTQAYYYAPVLYLFSYPPYYLFYIYEVPTPNYLFIWIGFIILTVTFIVLGAASIAVRGETANSSASVAAGIVGIIGACFLVPFGLIMFLPAVPWLAGVFTLIGFASIMVTFILWAVVFFSSREI